MSTADLKTERSTADLQSDFHEAYVQLFTASSEIDPFALFTLKRLAEESGLVNAKRILAIPGQQTGLLRLWQGDRLDLSVEALVLRPGYKALFTEEELDEARKRLLSLGYPVE